jgi:hypothetical protein
MQTAYWYSGAVITPNKHGYTVALSKDRAIYRDTERKAKWAATAFRTLNGKTFQEQYAASSHAN